MPQLKTGAVKNGSEHRSNRSSPNPPNQLRLRRLADAGGAQHLDGAQGGGAAGLDTQLLEDFQQVLLHGGFADAQDGADFAVGLALRDIFTPIEPMLALRAALRARGVPLYVLSNTNELAVEFIRAHYPWFAEFDGHILSYEHGAMKPAAALYAATERLSGRRGAELFYFDDRPENVEAARARGWQAVVHTDPARSRAALAATGLLDGPPPVL